MNVYKSPLECSRSAQLESRCSFPCFGIGGRSRAGDAPRGDGGSIEVAFTSVVGLCCVGLHINTPNSAKMDFAWAEKGAARRPGHIAEMLLLCPLRASSLVDQRTS